MADLISQGEHLAFAQELASLRAVGRGMRRRIEQDATTTMSRLLLVEDDLLMRALISATLAPESYELREAGTTEEALACLREEPPSLVILDLGLPDGSGLAVCRAMRADPQLSRVPVIAVTGAADDASKAAGQAAGIDRYITKPFSPLQLLRAIEDMVCR
jgi:DNA-binding response OmpR family regulator